MGSKNQLVEVREFSFGQLFGVKKVLDNITPEEYSSLLTFFDAGLLYFLETRYGGKEVVEAATRLARQHGGVENLRKILEMSREPAPRVDIPVTGTAEYKKVERERNAALGKVSELEQQLKDEASSHGKTRAELGQVRTHYQAEQEVTKELRETVDDYEKDKKDDEDKIKKLEKQAGNEQRACKSARDELTEKTRAYEKDIAKLTEDVTRLTNQSALNISAHQAQLKELEGQCDTAQGDLSAAKKDAEDYKKESSGRISDAESAKTKAEARAAEAQRKYSKLEQDVSGSEKAHKDELDDKDRSYAIQIGELQGKVTAAEERVREYESGVEITGLRLQAEKAKTYEEELVDARTRADAAEGKLAAAEQEVKDAKEAVRTMYESTRQGIAQRGERGRKVPGHDSKKVKI